MYFNFLDNNKLKKHEFRFVFLLQANIFLIISVLLILKSIFTGLLLDAYGYTILPYAYMTLAVGAIAVHLAFEKIFKNQNLHKTVMNNHCFDSVIINN